MILRFRPDAVADLEDMYDYIAEDNPNTAGEFIGLIEEMCQTIATTPFMGRDRSELRAGLRSFGVRRYVIFYRVLEKDGVVEIINVIHGARDIEGFFEH